MYRSLWLLGDLHGSSAPGPHWGLWSSKPPVPTLVPNPGYASGPIDHGNKMLKKRKKSTTSVKHNSLRRSTDDVQNADIIILVRLTS